MSEKILISLGKLSDEMIEEAITASGAECKKIWRKFIPAAASLFLIITGIIVMIVCRNSQGIGIGVNPDNSQIASTDIFLNPCDNSLYVYYEGIDYVYYGYCSNVLPEGFEYAGRANNIGENIPEHSFDSNYDGRIYINESKSDVIYFRLDKGFESKMELFLILNPKK